MNECSEVAGSMAPGAPVCQNYDQAIAHVRSLMPGESETVISNVAESLFRAQRPATPGPWRYEATTKTIRSVPANYWLATMDSWDGAVNHAANAKLIAAAPEMLEALRAVLPWIYDDEPEGLAVKQAALAALAKVSS